MFAPVDIGTAGRRAIAWFTKNGLIVSATDSDAAGHAIAIVLEALDAVGRPIDPRWVEWTFFGLDDFPAFPDDACTEQQETWGDGEVDSSDEVVGFGYVKPAAHGHENGGALFDPATHNVQHVEPRTVWMIAHSTERAS